MEGPDHLIYVGLGHEVGTKYYPNEMQASAVNGTFADFVFSRRYSDIT